MHYHCEVILKSCTNIEEDIERLMEPFNENREVDKYISKTRDDLISDKKREIEKYKNGTYKEFLDNPTEYIKDCKNENHIEYLKNEFPKQLTWSDEECYQDAISCYDEHEISPCGGIYSTAPKGAFWDWYSIGGRWSGIKLEGYEPTEDILNKEDCWLCKTSGKREFKGEIIKCNGCDGTGKSLKHASKWVNKGNICEVREVGDDLSVYTLIVEGKGVFHKEVWDGVTFVKTGFNGNVKNKLNELGVDNGFVVTVDYHC